jgi:hypothetical protein
MLFLHPFQLGPRLLEIAKKLAQQREGAGEGELSLTTLSFLGRPFSFYF